MQGMTEQEASVKWCPMYRIVIDENTSFDNRGMNTERESTYCCIASRCIASRCMAWRWVSNHAVELSNTEGYCGLGGK